jgi:Kelch motif
VTNLFFLKPNSAASYRDQAAEFAIDNFGYVLGGLTTANNTSTNVVYKFNPADNVWTEASNVAAEDDTKKGRFYQVAAAIKTKAFVGLGASGSADIFPKQKDFYEHLPK